MPPDGSLKDEPSAITTGRKTIPDNLAREGSAKLDSAAQERMRPTATDSIPSLTLERRSSATQGNNGATTNQLEKMSGSQQQTIKSGTELSKKENSLAKPGKEVKEVGFRTSMASEDFTRKMTTVYKSYPEYLREDLKQVGYKVIIGHHITQADIRPDLAGIRPKGWPPGTTWDENDCFHDGITKTLAVLEFAKVGNKFVPNNRAEDALYHELSHAVDVAWGKNGKYFSESLDFIFPWKLDAMDIELSLTKMKPADREALHKKLDYYLQSESGYKETFAEALDMRIGQPVDKRIDRALFNKWFPRVSKLMDAKLESRQKLFLQRGKQ